ncbi:polyketide synthase [Pseudonocardia endophytica]|uniref:beta-ketoacyl [acyl carrier protein] synthase domain-containing protein n=1 Tax=Pseudonocardia endophytica TaxID=401976 RepID=UPI001A9DF4D7|nr:polyketide synthase [Pseudonocardia endophytica]
MTAADRVVVVGIGVEAPGGITTPAGLWSALTDGADMVGPMPDDRGWDLELLRTLGERDGWGAVPDAGGFLDGAALFDPAFFGITPREAVAMDPQQRVALRVAWRALEHAGIDPARAGGPGTACFLGALINDYGPSMAVPNEHNGYLLGGTSLSAIAGRVSHCLGATGPSMTVDTGCAASLTAVHLAVNALRLGECELALAGGVTVMGSEMMFVEFARNGALSATGRCRPYSACSTGTVWSEGAGVVVLERESRAAEHGHRVLGHVLAVTTNHNGGGSAMTVPGEAGQRQLVGRTLAAAGVAPEAVGLVEGHGTGTRVGDPIELSALAATYGAAAAGHGRRTSLGSVKSNLGHTQAAAGVMGLVKALLCGRHGRIVPTLFDDEPADGIDGSGLELPDRTAPWDPVDGWRRAAVSAFGIGGSNTHAIVGMREGDDHG